MKIIRGAKVLIRRASDGKYLILTASAWPENPRRSQKPDLPGGVVEDGEMIEEGLIREVKEEIGIDLALDALTLGYSLTFSENDTSRNFLIYVAEISGEEEVQLSWEHESYSWLESSEVLDLEIRAPYTDIFRYLQRVELLT